MKVTNIHFWSYLAQFFLEWKMFRRKVVEKIKTHILCSVTFLKKNRTVYEIMWKNIAERGRPQMAIWRMRIACWITKTTNAHTHRLCNTHCFSTATMVARTRLNLACLVENELFLKTAVKQTQHLDAVGCGTILSWLSAIFCKFPVGVVHPPAPPCLRTWFGLTLV